MGGMPTDNTISYLDNNLSTCCVLFRGTHYKGTHVIIIFQQCVNPAGYQGAVATAGLLSVLLIVCIAALSLLLFKAKQELFGIKSGATNMPLQGVRSPSSVSTVIDTKENVAYERVIMQSSHAAV